jgi:acetyl esterase/lipase
MVGLSILFGSSASAAASTTPGERVADQAQIGDSVRAVGLDSLSDLSVKYAGGVTGYPDVVYQTLLGYRPMTLDLFLPPPSYDKKGPRPWIIYIHGGGWAFGGKRRSAAYLDWPKVLASIAAQGFVVTSVSYRFSKEASSPAAIQDVKAAIRWLRANAAKYHLDPDRGMTWGQSAGGQLAALAAVTCGVKALDPPARVDPNAPNVEVSASAPKGADEVSDCVQGAVAWFGEYDFAASYKERKASAANAGQPDMMSLFLGCHGQCTAEQLRRPSPIAYVDSKDPPILLMHGTDDTTVNPAQSKAFEAALQKAGVRTKLVMLPGVGHSWIGKTPEATHHASKAALLQSMEFFESIIGDDAKK